MMTKYLIIGDSNTWGFDAKRFVETSQVCRLDQTWAHLFSARLGENDRVDVSAQNGRTINTDDTDWPSRNFSRVKEVVLEERAPIDIIIIALGTNDFKKKYENSPARVVRDFSDLLDYFQGDNQFAGQLSKPEIVVIAPCIIRHERAYDNEFMGAIEKIAAFIASLKELASIKGVGFWDANELGLELADDGIHFTDSDHGKFAEKLFEFFQHNEAFSVRPSM